MHVQCLGCKCAAQLARSTSDSLRVCKSAAQHHHAQDLHRNLPKRPRVLPWAAFQCFDATDPIKTIQQQLVTCSSQAAVMLLLRHDNRLPCSMSHLRSSSAAGKENTNCGNAAPPHPSAQAGLGLADHVGARLSQSARFPSRSVSFPLLGALQGHCRLANFKAKIQGLSQHALKPSIGPTRHIAAMTNGWQALRPYKG